MDLKKAEEEFIKYTKNYDLNDFHIKGKQTHSIRVMNLSTEIAKGLNLEKDEIELATLIGLLHDIARFEQYTQYHTFKDAISIDHGDLAVEILDKDIRKYINIDKYDEIIKLAIKNHNKYKIQEGLTQEQELFSQIIRDADKLDILYESVDMFWKGKDELVEKSEISPEVLRQFKSKKQVDRSFKKSEIDDVISVIAFIFDMNYKSSFEILKRENYINKILNRYEMQNENTKIEVDEIRKIANNYIEEKVKCQ